MNAGLAISALGHGAVLLWILLDIAPRPDDRFILPEAVPVRLITSDAPELAAPSAIAAPDAPAPQDIPQPAAPPGSAERVTPLPVPPPPDRALPAELPQAALRPEPSLRPDIPPVPPRPAEAPPASVEQIIPDAPPLAPQSSPQPAPRPQPEAISAAPNDALEPPSDAPALPETVVPAPVPQAPLTAQERDGLRLAVGRCWNFGALSIEAAQVTVTVAMDMQPDGRPVSSSLRLASYEGGSAQAARQAFDVARRAILRCAGEGYPLPREKYAQWQEIEMVFNPDKMRGR
ncbi:MAG: energy transducer TonB [Mangrovicoccus sp.]|nr:energy transducer TonB [Mangrovicoccus sp.]